MKQDNQQNKLPTTGQTKTEQTEEEKTTEQEKTWYLNMYRTTTTAGLQELHSRAIKQQQKLKIKVK